eukprot:GEMP01030113.1.p1 GENE.GEMP01030113.1~~GEMP01030113.1.p1  ORF type:complete len:352 (+),score=96.93 GEMP01030113.1:107-1162(+)
MKLQIWKASSVVDYLVRIPSCVSSDEEDQQQPRRHRMSEPHKRFAEAFHESNEPLALVPLHHADTKSSLDSENSSASWESETSPSPLESEEVLAPLDMDANPSLLETESTVAPLETETSPVLEAESASAETPLCNESGNNWAPEIVLIKVEKVAPGTKVRQMRVSNVLHVGWFPNMAPPPPAPAHSLCMSDLPAASFVLSKPSNARVERKRATSSDTTAIRMADMPACFSSLTVPTPRTPPRGRAPLEDDDSTMSMADMSATTCIISRPTPMPQRRGRTVSIRESLRLRSDEPSSAWNDDVDAGSIRMSDLPASFFQESRATTARPVRGARVGQEDEVDAETIRMSDLAHK